MRVLLISILLSGVALAQPTPPGGGYGIMTPTASNFYGPNAETITNDTDDRLKFCSTGGTYNECVSLDLDSAANVLKWLSGTGATSWLYSGIGIELKPVGAGEVTSIGLYDADGQRLYFYTAADRAFIESQGGALGLQAGQVQDVKIWESIASGNPSINIYGWNTAGSDLESVELTMDDTNDEFLIRAANSANHEGITVELDEANQLFRVRGSDGAVDFSSSDTALTAVNILYAQAGATVTGANLDVQGQMITEGDGTYSWTHSPTGIATEGSAEIDGALYADGGATIVGLTMNGNIDLDTNAGKIILDDGATGAGNLAVYFGQDTDLGFYRSAANTVIWEAGTGTYQFTAGALSLGSNLDLTLGGSAAYVQWGSATKVSGHTNSQFRILNSAGTAFALLQLGPDEHASDAAVAGSTIKTTNAYSQAETNTTGGPLYLGGGVGTKEIKIVQASASGNTLTFVVDGTSTTITTDTEWNCTTNDATCCAELETYLDANIAGFTATCDTVDEVYLDPATTTRDLSLASADAAGTKFVVVDGVGGPVTFAVAPVFADYTRHHDVPIGAAIVGAAAPAVETIGTFRCYVFDANADLAHISVEVPSEWNGTSDMAIDLLIFTDDGDILGNGEIIEFDLVYRSVDEGEAYDNNAAVTINATVTGGAAEVDKGQYKITATVDYDDTDQPLAVNDTLGFSIMRDVTTGDTYSGDVHVCRAQLVYTANALATH